MLSRLTDWLVFGVFGLNPEEKLAQSLHFFIYDSIKIIILLFVMIGILGFLRTYLSQRKVKEWLVGRGVSANIAAAFFGAVTPFCSCSSIPIFLSFLKAGIPLGVMFSFLVASPLVDMYLVVLMIGFFGWKISLMYVVSGLVIGTVVGVILGKMKLERFLVEDMVDVHVHDEEKDFPSMRSRIDFGWNEAVSIVHKLWMWILVGMALGAVIHNYVPQEAIQEVLSKTGVFSVPIAALIGVPIYGSCAAIVPIAVVLFQKGIPLGTALAFMMAASALSLPEAVMLRRAMRLPLIVIFFGITTLGIIFTGYLFNFFRF